MFLVEPSGLSDASPSLHRENPGSTQLLQLLTVAPRLALQPIHGWETPWYEILLRPEAMSAESLVMRAGRLGLASMLDLWVTRAALPRMSSSPAHCYSFNVSPLSLADPGFVEDLLDLAWQHACEAKRVIVEVLEIPSLNPVQRHNAVISIRVLRTFGVRVALDDVSAGRSHPIPFEEADILKLDCSVITALREPGSHRCRELVIALVRTGLSIVAEGVEQASDLAHLRELGVTTWQGFLGGHPQPWEIT